MDAEKAQQESAGVYYASDEPIFPGESQSHVFCCDTRRATIILNIINIVIAAMSFSLVAVGTSESFANAFDDDEVNADLLWVTNHTSFDMLTAGPSVGFSVLGIIGAWMFNEWMVLLAGMAFVGTCITSLVFVNIGGAILSALVAYPHYFLFQEIKKGIMTPRTYGVYYACGAEPKEPVEGESRSHTVCGVCCDTRRATIIVNILNVFIAAMTFTLVAVVSSENFAEDFDFDDDEVNADVNWIVEHASFDMLTAVPSVVFSLVGIYGAWKFNEWMVALAGISFIVNCVFSLTVALNIGSAMLSFLFAYPHLFLYDEISGNIMTPNTYESEKYSCCCVKNPRPRRRLRCNKISCN